MWRSLERGVHATCPPERFNGKKLSDPVDMLSRLCAWLVPRAEDVFVKGKAYLNLLHLNDYVLDKTFVYCVRMLSKWLGHKRFPQGIFSWPVSIPPEVLPKAPTQERIDMMVGALEGAASSSA